VQLLRLLICYGQVKKLQPDKAKKILMKLYFRVLT